MGRMYAIPFAAAASGSAIDFFEITAADDKDYTNTNATNAVGDLVTILGDGADGWYVIEERGTWAREP